MTSLQHPHPHISQQSSMAAMENAQQPQHPQQLPQDDTQSLYKSQLQQYAQRAGLGLPMYEIENMGQQHAPQFRCSVTVDDETYGSQSTFSQKKAAEQDAAKHALKCIFEKMQEKGSSIISKNTSLCKAILHEFAAKLQIERPKYNTFQLQQVPLPLFVSTLEFRGVSYIGGPAKTKRDAEQLVAHDVIISILGDSKEETTLLEILISKDKLFSATQLSKDRSCAIRPDEGLDGVASTLQLVYGSEVLMSTSNEEQFKDAGKSPALQTEGVPLCLPPVQTVANESLKVTSPSPTDCSVFLVPSSSQNPITPPMQVFTNEGCKITPAPQAHGPVSLVPSSSQNPIIPPMQVFAYEGCKITPAPQAHGPVSLVPPSSQNPLMPPVHNFPNQSCEVTSVPQVNSSVFPGLPQNPTTNPLQNFASAPQVHGSVPLVPPPSQNPVASPMHNFANQSSGIGYVQGGRPVFPGLPQNSTTPLQNFAHQGRIVIPAQPRVVPIAAAAAPIQDLSTSCASQSTKTGNRTQRKRANKKARMANQ